jgi:tRNA modification GTPase
MSAADTIFAIASGAGKAGVDVWRISGPEARAAGELLSKRKLTPRRAVLARFVDPGSGGVLDEGLAILFLAPKSYTGEDVVELHAHGGRAVRSAIAAALTALALRPAAAGEFTQRAFLNGRIDLAGAEALADLIDAETSLQRMQALGQLGGALSARAEAWKSRLIAALTPLEAAIDFPDEEGVPAAVAARAGPEIAALASDLRAHIETAGKARRLREGVEAVLIGAPNAGKSSLMNALAGAEVAIVAPTPGTTRDVLETRLDLGGVPVLLADTAGLRDAAPDPIEIEGARRARARAEAADLRVLVIDPLTEDRAGFELLRAGDLLAWSKKDLGGAPGDAPKGVVSIHVSSRTGAGMAGLLAALSARAADLAAGAGEGALTRLRHVFAVERALAALERAGPRIAAAPELAAEDVRLAARALASITGAVDVEEVLAGIFARFCIGK